MKPTILDCTLRDGGYYTNWDFNKDLVKEYLSNLNKLPVEWVELGYRSKPQKSYLGEYFYCPDYVLEMARSVFKGKIAIMFNEKDIKPEDVKGLLNSAKGKVDMIRLAIDPKNILRAVELANEIKKHGFLVGFNVMYMSKWKNQPEFLDLLPKINSVADYLYMVDSYGGIYPNEVKEILAIVKEKVTIPIGFHGHNNMELALINAITALENGAGLIDATVTGMGRGAGNLKTELFLTALNAKGVLEVDFNALSDLTHLFEKLQEEYQWGTNLPYMVSGANSLPQKDVMDWVGKRFYSYNSIIRALHNQKVKVSDNERFPLFKPDNSFERVLLVGGGKSIPERYESIIEFLKNNPDIAVIHSSSRNSNYFKDIDNEQFFCLVGNEGNRLEKVFKDFGDFKGICVLPAYPRKMGTYVPTAVYAQSRELKEVGFTTQLTDTHTAIALEIAFILKAKTVFTVGYDGYSNALISNRDFELFNENEYLFSQFKENTRISLISLTPTLYKSFQQDSVYSKI